MHHEMSYMLPQFPIGNNEKFRYAYAPLCFVQARQFYLECIQLYRRMHTRFWLAADMRLHDFIDMYRGLHNVPSLKVYHPFCHCHAFLWYLCL